MLFSGGCRAIDAVTLCEEMFRRKELEDIGGAGYIAEIVEAVPHAAHVRYYAGIVREKSRIRNLIYLCTDTLKHAYDATDADELIAELDSRTMRLRDVGSTGELHSMNDAVDAVSYTHLDVYKRQR